MKGEDVVKVDLGVHIDSLVTVVAHTIVVGGKTITARKADVILAAPYASQAALRLLKTGNETILLENNQCDTMSLLIICK